MIYLYEVLGLIFFFPVPPHKKSPKLEGDSLRRLQKQKNRLISDIYFLKKYRRGPGGGKTWLSTCECAYKSPK